MAEIYIGDLITNIVNAIVSVFSTVATTLSENAETLALLLVMGVVVTGVVKFGTSLMRGFRRLIPL